MSRNNRLSLAVAVALAATSLHAATFVKRGTAFELGLGDDFKALLALVQEKQGAPQRAARLNTLSKERFASFEMPVNSPKIAASPIASDPKLTIFELTYHAVKATGAKAAGVVPIDQLAQQWSKASGRKARGLLLKLGHEQCAPCKVWHKTHAAPLIDSKTGGLAAVRTGDIILVDMNVLARPDKAVWLLPMLERGGESRLVNYAGVPVFIYVPLTDAEGRDLGPKSFNASIRLWSLRRDMMKQAGFTLSHDLDFPALLEKAAEIARDPGQWAKLPAQETGDR